MKDVTFSSARLLALYDRISDAEDAIPRLRQTILNLAVRGKLVEQDVSDEPIAELLKRIAKLTRSRENSGVFREPKSFVDVQRDLLPFVPPLHWGWARLIELSEVSYGFAFDSARFNDAKRGMPLIRIRDISGTDTVAYYEGDFDDFYLVEEGDFLVGMDGDFNVRRWAGRDALLNQRVMRMRQWCPEALASYVALPLQEILNYLHGVTSLTTVKHLSAKQVNGIEIPLPPLAEQQRIVAKVDELMALCDQLEQARAGREAVRDRLTTASLARLTAPETDAEALPAEVGTALASGNATNTSAFQSHARFALQSLTTLTTRPDQIKTLRQTILNLAVRGKLVAQDPIDEPAAELLKRVGAAHPKRKNLKKHEFGVPNQLADGWSVAHLDAIASFENGDRSSNYPSGSDIKSEGIAFFSTKNLMDNRLHFSNLDFITNEKFASLRSGKLVDQDILITLRGSVGKFGIFEATPSISTGFINAQLMIIRCVDRAIVPYLLRFMQSGIFSEQITRLSSGSATPQLSAGKLGEAELWLPPLAEQHRIVTKVDALMALCDQLEASLTTTATTRSKLLNALLHEALEPAADELEAAE